MNRRYQRHATRLSTFSILLASMLYLAFRVVDLENLPLPWPIRIQDRIAAGLGNAVLAALKTHRNRSIPILLEPNSPLLADIQALQRSLAHSREQERTPIELTSRLKMRLSQLSKPSPEGPPQSTSLHHYRTTTDSLCKQLIAQTILFIGPPSTFHLHSHLLEHTSGSTLTPPCPGIEFCTFHHIYLPPSSQTSAPPEDRFKTLPGIRDLVSTNSSIMRYVLSDTLYSDTNPKKPRYTKPYIDPSTGVRVKNGYWIKKARTADVIVLNRGPMPAPAVTYDGNWSFADHPILLPAYKLVGNKRDRLISAAFHVTLNTFLPGVIRTLHGIRIDPLIRGKRIIWHGITFTGSGDVFVTGDGRSEDDPWSLYHDAQVSMQNILLPLLLPHYGILYIPMSNNRRMDNQRTDDVSKSIHSDETKRHPKTQSSADQRAFLALLETALREMAKFHETSMSP